MKIDLNPEPKILRQFGFISLFGFGLIATVAWWKLGAPPWLVWSLVGLGVAMSICAMARADALIRPVYVLLMLIAIPIGLVISTVLMLLIWFLMFTPLALWFRLIGRDPLNRKLEPGARSYWHERAASRPPSSYLKMY